MALPVADSVARPNVTEIERLMMLRGYTRRKRLDGEWTLLPDWANLSRDSGLTPGAGYDIRDGKGSPRLVTLSSIAKTLGAMTRDIIDEEED